MNFKPTKNKIISLIAIVAVLAGAFWYGGDAPGLEGVEPSEEEVVAKTQDKNTEKEDNEEEKNQKETTEEESKEEFEKEEESEKTDEENVEEEEKETTEEKEETKTASSNSDPQTNTDNDKQSNGRTTNKKETNKKANSDKSSADTTNKKAQSSGNSEMKIDPKTGKDKYQTDPTPAGKPKPVEPEETEVKDVQNTATLSVRADTALDNIDRIDPAIAKLIPKDGVIFSARTVSFKEGESVFDVLQREMRNAGIHMEASFTPMYNSAYVEGINNLYEFDAGELSGWMYRVNGWFPNYGASRYQLEDGDVVEWLYTAELGADIGGSNSYGE